MTSLIRSLTLRNFKGFSDEVRVELRPITLLFGANSAGKSSVLQALQLVREILERGDANVDRTRQGGDTIDLGGFSNFVHNRDLSREVTLSVELELGDDSIPEFFEDAIEDRSDVDAEVWRFHETLDIIRNQVKQVAVRLNVRWSDFLETVVISGYRVDFNGDWCAEVVTDRTGQQPKLALNVRHAIFEGTNIESGDLFDVVASWVRPDAPDAFGDELGLVRKQTEHGLHYGLIPESVLLPVLDVVFGAYADSPNAGFSAWLRNFRGALPSLDKPIQIPAGRPETASNVFVLQEFSAFMSWLLIGPCRLLLEQLKKSRYLGPLRRIPPRDFDHALTKNEGAWSDGMAAWQTLLGGTDHLVAACSDWMSHPEKLATGYGLKRSILREFDVSGPEPVPLGDKRRRLTLLDGTGLPHLPQDVGVGISQVLPVVVAAQDRSAGLVTIEQPELHIHPAVQVGLGDLFIDGAMQHGLSFLIETHSEHLILRLLRRIREAHQGDLAEGLPELHPDDVAINCLTRSNGAVRVDRVPVTVEGDFAKRWPQGFFDERGAELF